MIPLQYAYLVGSLALLGVWFFLFMKMPWFVRKAMLYGSLLFALAGPVWAYFNFIEVWWNPRTFTNTVVGLEDGVLAFSCIGIALSGYKFVFRKEARKDFKIDRKAIWSALSRLPAYLIASFAPIPLLHYAFGVHPIVSIFCGQLAGGIYVWFRRPDLAAAMIWTAVIMIAVTYPIFIAGRFVCPGVIEEFWNFDNLTGYVPWGYPLEDMIFFGLWGFQCGGMLEFMFDCRLADRGSPPTVLARL